MPDRLVSALNRGDHHDHLHDDDDDGHHPHDVKTDPATDQCVEGVWGPIDHNELLAYQETQSLKTLCQCRQYHHIIHDVLQHICQVDSKMLQSFYNNIQLSRQRHLPRRLLNRIYWQWCCRNTTNWVCQTLPKNTQTSIFAHTV